MDIGILIILGTVLLIAAVAAVLAYLDEKSKKTTQKNKRDGDEIDNH